MDKVKDMMGKVGGNKAGGSSGGSAGGEDYGDKGTLTGSFLAIGAATDCSRT